MKKSGFTLIELIFVIVIIGLLAAVAVPKFLATKKNAETANLSNMGNQLVNKANEQYNLVGTKNIDEIIDADKDLNRTMADWNNRNDFSADANATDFNITYTSTGAVCLQVQRQAEDVNISKTATVHTYNFAITELNTTCNQEQ